MANMDMLSKRCSGSSSDNDLTSIITQEVRSRSFYDSAALGSDPQNCEIAISLIEPSRCPCCGSNGLISHGSQLPSCAKCVKGDREKKAKTEGLLKLCIACGKTVCDVCEKGEAPASAKKGKGRGRQLETPEAMYVKLMKMEKPCEKGDYGVFIGKC
jgi:hypothetical protein